MIGIKYDQDKLDWTLLPFDTLESVVEVLEFGAAKYDRDNWKKVEPKERYLQATFRHLIQHTDGEFLDIESGKPHLAHAICSLLFLLHKENEIAKVNNTTEGSTEDPSQLQFSY